MRVPRGEGGIPTARVCRTRPSAPGVTVGWAGPGCSRVVFDCPSVSTAAPSHHRAVAPARPAVRAGLAAGAQGIGPVIGRFWHASEFGSSEELQLLPTTTAVRYRQLAAHLVERHS
ncbi:divalent cation tolerance protein CutA [Streptomyces sp. NPDC092369]|uniref:divalent cation tolerance protein CutA n=1 Tax=Streptomyces sp. NPDC092369 TaxID=3366015 RepID=UPI00381EBCDA